MINDSVYLKNPGRLLLVPYLPHHVPRYHTWMCRPDLLAATESEPLSLEEEIENQRSWLSSQDKLTFIIYGADSEGAAGAASPEDNSGWKGWTGSSIVDPSTDTVEEDPLGAECLTRYIPSKTKNMFTRQCVPNDTVRTDLNQVEKLTDSSGSYTMIGDCNLFLLNNECESAEGSGEESSSVNSPVFEVEVMIAEEHFRRRGMAEGAVRLLITFAQTVLGGNQFIAKVLESNENSVRLFQDKLKFQLHKKVPVFHEVHLRRDLRSVSEKEEWARECHDTSGGRPFLCGPYLV